MDFANAIPSDVAAHFVQRQFAVLPVMENGKTPAIKRGVHDASKDPDTVTNWFRKLEKTGKPNIGIACGQASGIVVIDIDVKTCDDAFLNASELCGFSNLWEPDTLIVDTPSGGQHWYFAAPDFPVKNAVNLAPGVDIRADGGYVVAPGSWIDGKGYCLARDNDLAALPESVLQALSNGSNKAAADLSWADCGGPGATEGSRNDALFKYACTLTNTPLTPDELLAAVSTRNQSYQPPLPDAEVQTLVKHVVAKYHKPQGETNRRNRLLTLGDIRDMPRPVPLIRDVLYSDQEHLVFGRQGVSKTFVLLDMALHIATGRPWRDRPIQQGNVVYIAGEGGGRVLADRIDAWIKFHKVDEAEIHRRLRITAFPVAMLDQGEVDEILQLIEEFGTTHLVIADTLSANFGPGDENSPVDMGRFCSAMRRIRLATKAGVVAVHHPGHADRTRAQGSNKILRDFDIELRVDRDCEDETLFGIVGGGRYKNRNGAGCGMIPYRLLPIELEHDGFGEVVSSAVIVPTEDVPDFDGKQQDRSKALGSNQSKVLKSLRRWADSNGYLPGNKVIVAVDDWKRIYSDAGLGYKAASKVKRTLLDRGVFTFSVGGFAWEFD